MWKIVVDIFEQKKNLPWSFHIIASRGIKVFPIFHVGHISLLFKFSFFFYCYFLCAVLQLSTPRLGSDFQFSLRFVKKIRFTSRIPSGLQIFFYYFKLNDAIVSFIFVCPSSFINFFCKLFFIGYCSELVLLSLLSNCFECFFFFFIRKST